MESFLTRKFSSSPQLETSSKRINLQCYLEEKILSYRRSPILKKLRRL